MPKKKTIRSKKKSVKKVAGKATQKAAKKAVAKKDVKKVSAKAPSRAKKAAAASPTPEEENKAPSTESRISKARIPAADPKSTPIVFSLDDVEELMASKKSAARFDEEVAEKTEIKSASVARKKVILEEEPARQRVLGAASLADILGFNPAEKQKSTDLTSKEVPKKWKRYYDLLTKLRAHVRDELDLHTSETLKHSSRDDSGDLSSYGTHQADAGTDTFDRDFALSLVSSEQDALNEIEEAILRIKNGTYGTCEVTGKAIPAARLAAVPFARYSVEGQAEYEKNLRRKVDRSSSAGLFSDASDAPKLAASDDEE